MWGKLQLQPPIGTQILINLDVNIMFSIIEKRICNMLKLTSVTRILYLIISSQITNSLKIKWSRVYV